jgi:hypothetical protein
MNSSLTETLRVVCAKAKKRTKAEEGLSGQGLCEDIGDVVTRRDILDLD